MLEHVVRSFPTFTEPAFVQEKLSWMGYVVVAFSSVLLLHEELAVSSFNELKKYLVSNKASKGPQKEAEYKGATM